MNYKGIASQLTGVGERFRRSPASALLLGISQGIGGIFILLLFCSSFLASTSLVSCLPFILGFNGAACGYGLQGSRGGTVASNKFSLMSLAIVLSAAGCGLINLFSSGWELMSAIKFFIPVISVLCSTFIGAWIASQQERHQETRQLSTT